MDSADDGYARTGGYTAAEVEHTFLQFLEGHLSQRAFVAVAGSLPPAPGATRDSEVEDEINSAMLAHARPGARHPHPPGSAPRAAARPRAPERPRPPVAAGGDGPASPAPPARRTTAARRRLRLRSGDGASPPAPSAGRWPRPSPRRSPPGCGSRPRSRRRAPDRRPPAGRRRRSCPACGRWRGACRPAPPAAAARPPTAPPGASRRRISRSPRVRLASRAPSSPVTTTTPMPAQLAVRRRRPAGDDLPLQAPLGAQQAGGQVERLRRLRRAVRALHRAGHGVGHRRQLGDVPGDRAAGEVDGVEAVRAHLPQVPRPVHRGEAAPGHPAGAVPGVALLLDGHVVGPPDGPGGDQPAHLLDAVGVAEDEGDLVHQPPRPGLARHLRRQLPVEGHRLLAEDVLPRPQGGHRCRCSGCRWTRAR